MKTHNKRKYTLTHTQLKNLLVFWAALLSHFQALGGAQTDYEYAYFFHKTHNVPN